jgi:large subunit ribosomal protein L22
VAATETPQEVRAEAKWVRTSPRKARVVLEHIRGRTVPEARTVLAFTSRAAARDIEKVLRSAVANAEANHGLSGDDLVVTAAYANDGPTIKRFRPRARGRVNRIFKRTCHITVLLTPAEPRGHVPRAEAAQGEEKPKRTPKAAPPPTTAEEPSSEEKATKRRTRQTKKAQEVEG